MFRCKGQFNVEYFVVLMVFLIFSLYFAFRLIEFYPEYLKNVKEEILRSDAYRLSEILINDDGEPAAWAGLPLGSIKRIGLSLESLDDYNLLSSSKVADLETKCQSSYETVKKLVGATHDFYIFVNDTNNVYECNSLPAVENVAVVRRVVAFENGNYGKLIVYMWW